jgi:thiol:disulfide interchange protein
VLGYGGVVIARHFTSGAEAAWRPGSGQASHGVWTRYTHKGFEEARKEGKIVVVLTTAVWCINCKALEAQLRTEEVLAALTSPDVAAIEVDLSAKNEPGSPSEQDWEYLRSIREAGPPVLTIYAPGQEAPTFQSNAYTAAGVLEGIEAARNTARAASQTGN